MVGHGPISSFGKCGRYLSPPLQAPQEQAPKLPKNYGSTNLGHNTKSAEAVNKRVQKAALTTAITFIARDLASLASVKAAADKILADSSRLDVFMINAEVMFRLAGLSTDGYEIQFATNRFSHPILTQKLLPLLERTADFPGADLRVMYISSTGFRAGQLYFDRFKKTMEEPVVVCGTAIAS